MQAANGEECAEEVILSDWAGGRQRPPQCSESASVS